MFGSKKYTKSASQNILSKLSSDISRSHKRYLNMGLISVGIENYLPIPSQYFYLYFLTKRWPFMARKHPSKKKYRFGEMAKDTAKFISYINQFRLGRLFKKLYIKLMRGQLSPEQSAVRIDNKYIKIIIWNAPLTKETNCLQINQNAFLADIPVYYKFSSRKTLSRESAFFIKFYEFLRPLWLTTWWLQMSWYHEDE